MTTIAMLEDDARRRGEMLGTLRESIPDAAIGWRPDAHEFIAWLARDLSTIDLLCLDHDLVPPASDPKRDPGDGRDVVRWLLRQPVRRPVLIHTTNGRCGGQMES